MFNKSCGPDRPRGYNPSKRNDRAFDVAPTKQTDFIEKLKQDRRQLVREKFWACGKSEERIQKLYNELDEDGDGLVSYKEFSRGMGRLGLGFLVEDGKHLFSQIDVDNSGSLDFKETKQFSPWITGKRMRSILKR